MPKTPMPGQLDLLDLLRASVAPEDRKPRCMYHSPARGLTARAAEWEAWRAEFGICGSLCRSHAWTVALCDPDQPTARCMPTALSCDLRAPWPGADWATWPDCDCCTTLNDLRYRGACCGCDWEGPSRPGENPAVEDACDHAWPGWRDVPIVPAWPSDMKRQERWLATVVPQYPAGWLEAGGPIRTLRQLMGTRHNATFATPWGGYDMAVLAGAA